MTRTQIGLLVTAVALAVLLVGGWIAFFLIPAGTRQATPPAVEATASSTTEVASTSSSLPPPKPVPTYAQAAPDARTTGTGLVAPSTAAKTAAVTAPTTATLIVGDARFPLHAPAGATLEAAMSQLRAEGGLSYKVESYAGLGSFVTEIQGRAGGNGMYWILYVNGKKSSTGISSTRIRSGDVIEWKLEKSY